MRVTRRRRCVGGIDNLIRDVNSVIERTGNLTRKFHTDVKDLEYKDLMMNNWLSTSSTITTKEETVSFVCTDETCFV